LGFRIPTSLGNGARVVWGTKCIVYNFLLVLYVRGKKNSSPYIIDHLPAMFVYPWLDTFGGWKGSSLHDELAHIWWGGSEDPSPVLEATTVDACRGGVGDQVSTIRIAIRTSA